MPSIAITAPTKFDFQDLACVDLALRFEGRGAITLEIEPDGGEDARLTLAGGPTKYEIQVKGSAERVTLGTLAACLAHCLPRKPTGCLLERLLGDPNLFVVLLMTGRCDDAASRYAASAGWAGLAHEHPPPIAETKALLDALAGVDPTVEPATETTPLMAARAQHFRAISKTDPAVARVALQRLIVLENVSDLVLEGWCERHLRSRYRIPVDRIADVVGRLRVAIKRAKTERIDAAPLLKATLTSSAPASVRPQAFIPRGSEDEWKRELTAKNSLLLSGPPRCGKSDAARWVAAEFETLGYEIETGNDVEAAARSLQEPGPVQRLYVLDDPLGSSTPKESARRALEHLRRLVPRLSPNRKVIVAQSQEVLLLAAGSATLAGCAPAGRPWHNLATSSRQFLNELWLTFATESKVETRVRDLLSSGLLNGEASLEPGCLRHLASVADKLPRAPTMADLVRTAMEDAAELGTSLADISVAMRETLACLAIGSHPSIPISQPELAFVAGSGGDGLPGKAPDSLGPTVIAGTGRTVASALPAYDSSPQLDRAVRAALDQLERRRMVAADANQSFSFEHPYYRAAAESTLRNPTSMTADMVLRMTERALFALLASTTRAAAQNLDWLYETLSERAPSRISLVQLAITGLESRFPSTRDRCFSFLIRHSETLPQEFRANVSAWADAVASLELSDLEWVDGEARIKSGEADRGSWIRELVEPDDAGAPEIVRALNDTSAPYISSEHLARALRYLRRRPTELTSLAVSRLLSCSEGVLRAEAASIWLATTRIDDGDSVARIFDDEHPAVLDGALKSATRAWGKYPPERRTLLLERFGQAAGSSVSAAILMRRLVLFDREEHSGEDPPWELFARILPSVLRALPPNAHFVEARLWSVAESASEVIAPPQFVEICRAWIDWLAREVEAGRVPNDFVLGVGEILVRSTLKSPELREQLLERLFLIPSTAVLVVTVRDLVRSWDDLSPAERARVLSLIATARDDLVWLQAAAIAQRHVPEEIERAVLQKPGCLAVPPAALVDGMPDAVLRAAVAVQTGSPQPLWWIGVHHGGGPIWEAVIAEIARRPSHPMFPRAFQDVLLKGDDELAEGVVRTAVGVDARAVFRQLLSQRVTWEGHWFPRTWERLLSSAPDAATRSRWFDQMAEAAPAAIDGLYELREWLPTSFPEVLKRLPADRAAISIVRALEELPPNTRADLAGRVLDALMGLLKSTPPRLFGTYDQLIEAFAGMQIDLGPLKPVLDEHRAKSFEVREGIEKRFEPVDEQLEHWLGPPWAR